MNDYGELVKDLRDTYRVCLDRMDGQVMLDAAAAIEELQAEVERLKAENPIVESVLVDKMRQQMEETACHCNVKENAELIARILDDDVDGKTFELPKRGKWEPFDLTYGRSIYSCSVCEQATEVPMCMEKPMYAYCPNCGAKMEVQDGR